VIWSLQKVNVYALCASLQEVEDVLVGDVATPAYEAMSVLVFWKYPASWTRNANCDEWIDKTEVPNIAPFVTRKASRHLGASG
jgi:uncharacterized protein YijF (DUF1287 family)